MINNVTLAGRLTKEPELRKTQTDKSVLSFTLACNRRFKGSNGETTADFPNCIAWNQSAEYLAGYAHQGDLVGVVGSIQTRNYDGPNGRVYVTEVMCDNVCILAHKQPDQPDIKIPNDSWQKGPGFRVNGEKEDLNIEIDELPFL